MTSGALSIALVVFGLVLAAAAAGAAVAVAFRKRRHAMEIEIECLRDEIWELRAAAAARDKAEAASRAKSRFLATVSHEIRTPLNGILGLAQLLAMTRLEAEQASYVEAIGDCSRALARLIDDILDFSKIEAGKLELRIEPFGLTQLVESVVELLAPRAHEKNLEISSFISADAPARILGDQARLRQVLINLAGNAVNFTEKGGVAVRVAVESPDVLRFEVEDTGPGVPASARKLIFEEFEQGDASATRSQGGTGLGLAISRRLVERMGGELQIAATSPRGTVFAFRLPAVAEAAKPGESRRRLPKQRRVLIVSESRFEAPFLAQYLCEAGASARIVSREEATKLLGAEANAYDDAIVDCAFGEDATKSLARAARAGGAARVFLLFSPLERRAFGEAALGDFDGWLVKPVRAASLIERLADATTPGVTPRPVAPEPCLAGLHVLLAEDNDINALIAIRHLNALGAMITRAENGARVVELAAAAIEGAVARYGVILMDLFMPELDGLEATKRIRRAEARAGAPRTPILALTATALEEDLRAAKVAGVDATLTKPVEFAKLAETIRALREAAPKIERRGKS
jgi:signal transduction histidine kinase/CheY-like chemotaxis protein